MRDLKRLQVAEKSKQEKMRYLKARVAEEDWDSQFQSTRQSLNFYPGKVEYSDNVQVALEKLLGKKGLEDLQMQGLRESAKVRKGEEPDDLEDQGDAENGEAEEDPEQPADPDDEDPGEKNEDDENPDDGGQKDQGDDQPADQDDPADKEDADKEADGPAEPDDEKKPEDEMKLPLEKPVKPWEKQDPEERTEIIVGVRYNKPFEHLFDDKQTLRDRKPQRIVRITAHYNKEFVVGMQFAYMTEQDELIPGKFHGNSKKVLDSLQVVQYEIQYRERIEKITVHFSKGIHWIEFTTNEKKKLLIGNKPKNGFPKAITVTKEVQSDKNEEVCYVSGGYTGKDYRFTYLAFHLSKAWDRPAAEDFGDKEGDGEGEVATN